MNASRYALTVFAGLIVLFVTTNLVASHWFAGARLDLTENRLYSLSRGTRETLASLNEPVTLTLYFSRDAAATDPLIRDYAGRVRELLRSYARESGGRVRMIEVEPLRFTEAEDKAVAAGLEPIDRGAGADPVFLGIVGGNAVDETVSLPQLTPDREAFLEYELTRLIAELQNPTKIKLGLVTSLPWRPELAGDAPLAGPGSQPLIVQEMARLAEIVSLPLDFSGIDSDIDVLAVIHPWALSEQQLYAIDQFILRKGRALIALDPAALTSPAATAFAVPGTTASSNLPKLLEAWGVSVSAEVVLDQENALPIQAQGPGGHTVVLPQPLYFTVPPETVDQRDLVTAGLSRGLNLGAPGAIVTTPKEGVAVSALARTSTATMRIPAAQAIAQPEPLSLLQGFVPASRSEIVAARVTGRLPSAFGATRPATVTAPSQDAHLAAAQEDATVILVSDVDLFDNNFYVGPQGQVLADNAAFVLNALDQLGGSTALLSLRSRAGGVRRLDAIDQIRNRAQTRAAQTQQQLQDELAATEQRLRTLQGAGGGSGSGVFRGDLGSELSAEERSELERFRTRVIEIRSELRALERGYRTELDSLKGWLMLINVWVAPLLVVAAGVFWSLRRRRTFALPIASPKAASPGRRSGPSAEKDEAA